MKLISTLIVFSIPFSLCFPKPSVDKVTFIGTWEKVIYISESFLYTIDEPNSDTLETIITIDTTEYNKDLNLEDNLVVFDNDSLLYGLVQSNINYKLKGSWEIKEDKIIIVIDAEEEGLDSMLAWIEDSLLVLERMVWTSREFTQSDTARTRITIDYDVYRQSSPNKLINAIPHSTKLVLVVSPNPFNPSTTISIPNVAGHSTLLIYDLAGNLIKAFADTRATSITWHPHNQRSGVYIAKLKVGDKVYYKKMVLIK